MKATEPKLRAALERPGDIRLFLLHGPDEAGALAYAARLGQALGTHAERIDLEPATLRSDPARLADEAASISLFGEPRWIRVNGAGEESVEAASALLQAAHAGNPVVMVAPSVRATGKLVKAALEASNALAFACYPPEGRNAETLAIALARDEGVRLDAAAGRRFAAMCDGDRAIMGREVTKLALYLDAAVDRPVDANESDLEAIGAGVAEVEVGSIVAALVGRDAALLARHLREAQGPEASPIVWLRALQRRLGSLADMRAEIDRGEGADAVVKRHRVFWKEEAATLMALQRWQAADLAGAQRAVRLAERAAMSGGDAARVVADELLLALARR